MIDNHILRTSFATLSFCLFIHLFDISESPNTKHAKTQSGRMVAWLGLIKLHETPLLCYDKKNVFLNFSFQPKTKPQFSNFIGLPLKNLVLTSMKRLYSNIGGIKMFPLKKEKRHVLGNATPKQIEQVTRGHNIVAYPQLKILVETKF